MNKVILIVAAHADDEVLGCGGTIARHVSEGDKVYIQFMTNGVGSRGYNAKAIIKRRTAAQKAAKILGAEDIFHSDFPDNQMDSIPLLGVVKDIEIIINKVKPQIIYTHFCGDLNIDHQVTHRAVLTACRPIKGSSVEEIYCFEIMSSTEWSGSTSLYAFKPNFIIDISSTLDLKMEALQAYSEELRLPPHSRSVEAIKSLALLRGHTHGFYAAEGFMVERLLKK